MNVLTICSVFHSENSKKYLELNQKLTTALNKRDDYVRLVVNNMPEGTTLSTFESKHFKVISGVPMAKHLETLEPWKHPLKVSTHWGTAQNLAMKQVDTPYAMILDGDFFIVRPNWITDVIDHMRTNNLALLGVEWHPRWYKKVRYFPTIHALVIDTKQLALKDLDLRPLYATEDEMPPKVVPLARPSLLSTLKANITMRQQVGTSKDSGHDFYAKYFGRVRNEIFLPVFKPYAGDNFFERTLKIGIDRILPDRYALIPKASSYTTRGFKERGYFDALEYGWEEFIWKDEPFGFHMRNTGNKMRTEAERMELAERSVQNFMPK